MDERLCCTFVEGVTLGQSQYSRSMVLSSDCIFVVFDRIIIFPFLPTSEVVERGSQPQCVYTPEVNFHKHSSIYNDGLRCNIVNPETTTELAVGHNPFLFASLYFSAKFHVSDGLGTQDHVPIAEVFRL